MRARMRLPPAHDRGRGRRAHGTHLQVGGGRPGGDSARRRWSVRCSGSRRRNISRLKRTSPARSPGQADGMARSTLYEAATALLTRTTAFSSLKSWDLPSMTAMACTALDRRTSPLPRLASRTGVRLREVRTQPFAVGIARPAASASFVICWNNQITPPPAQDHRYSHQYRGSRQGGSGYRPCELRDPARSP
jgi:hypothetical protein